MIKVGSGLIIQYYLSFEYINKQHCSQFPILHQIKYASMYIITFRWWWTLLRHNMRFTTGAYFHLRPVLDTFEDVYFFREWCFSTTIVRCRVWVGITTVLRFFVVFLWLWTTLKIIFTSLEDLLAVLAPSNVSKQLWIGVFLWRSIWSPGYKM